MLVHNYRRSMDTTAALATKTPDTLILSAVPLSDTVVFPVILVSWIILLLIAYRLVGAQRATAWDMAFFIVPLLVWHWLFVSGWKLKADSNAVEPLLLVPIFAAIYFVRDFASDEGSDQLASAIAFVLGTTLSVFVYLYMPTLPARLDYVLFNIAHAVQVALAVIDIIILALWHLA